MKTRTIITGVLLIGLTISLASFINKNEITAYEETTKIEISEGEKLFKAKCSACHITTKPVDMGKLVAPPIMGVMMHVKQGIKGKDKADKKAKSIDFIVDYVQNPSADKSLLEEHAIERFGVMPSQKENVTKKELEIIANYLYDNFPPKGMNHKKMHKGKNSCGSGCGGKCEH